MARGAAPLVSQKRRGYPETGIVPPLRAPNFRRISWYAYQVVRIWQKWLMPRRCCPASREPPERR
jgi:hypothetical protein